MSVSLTHCISQLNRFKQELSAGMCEKGLVYRIANAKWHIVLSEDVLKHMANYKQTRLGMSEAGGQLYAPSLMSETIDVCSASGPYPGDKRQRSGYSMLGDSASVDRQQKFNTGYHLCGLWHTHPEAIPSPSHTDVKAIQANLKLLPQWQSLMLVIQGTLSGHEGLFVGVYNQDNGLVRMIPEF